jgi:hypothetical protein
MTIYENQKDLFTLSELMIDTHYLVLDLKDGLRANMDYAKWIAHDALYLLTFYSIEELEQAKIFLELTQ